MNYNSLPSLRNHDLTMKLFFKVPKVIKEIELFTSTNDKKRKYFINLSKKKIRKY